MSWPSDDLGNESCLCPVVKAFTATATFSYPCEGYVGLATAFAWSTISQQDANEKAHARAKARARNGNRPLCDPAPVPPPPPPPEEGPIPGFVLFLCLDQTGSIGVGGAARGIEIIDTFRYNIGDDRIMGIGFVSFGDVICKVEPISSNLDVIRSKLVEAVETGGDFFCDSGGDTPENGVDALDVALTQMASSEWAQRAQFRYIYLKTDTAGFDHNSSNPVLVNERLNSSEVTKTWLEFGEDEGGTEYAETFPETSKVTHQPFDL